MRVPLFLVIYASLSVAGVLLFKAGSIRVPIHISFSGGAFDCRIGLHSLLGLLCYIASFIMYMAFIAKFNLTYVVPLAIGSVYVLTLLGAVILLNESLTRSSMLGCVLVLAGMMLIGLK